MKTYHYIDDIKYLFSMCQAAGWIIA